MEQGEASTAVARCDAALNAGITADAARQPLASQAAVAYRNGMREGVDAVMASRGYPEPTPGAVARAELRQRYGNDPVAAMHGVMAGLS